MMIDLDPHVDQYIVERAGEQKVLEVPRHWAAFIAPMIRLVVGIVLCAIAARGLQGFWYWLVLYAGWVFVWEAFWRHLRLFRDRFVITTTKVMRFQGVVSDHRAMIPLGRIVDVEVNRPWPSKHLGYGHLDFAHVRLELAGQLNDFQKIKFIREINRVEEILRIVSTKKKFDQAYEAWTPDEIRDVVDGS